ncbi:MAG: PQQ-binding-like beta-propeller repeat protein, partial [Acidobacteriota bacterium]|nr:PQQ-binding-like beta-propeller repeat protein [Acidobacteriota bacterium]
LYFGDWTGNFFAVLANDGAVLWQQGVGIAADPESPGCQPAIGVSSQAVVVGNLVYVGGGDSAIYALDRTSGDVVWRVPLADPASGSYLWSSITLSGNSLYIGIASLGDCPLVRGGLARIDLARPATPIIRYLAPKDETGAGVWSTPAVDQTTGTVFVTTGTGEQDVKAGLWGGTLLALDATSLQIKAHFFLPTNSLEDDIEWGSSPTVFSTADGSRLVAATGKDGVLYVLNASDLSLRYTVYLALSCICPECGCGALSTPAFDGTNLYVGAGAPDPESFNNGSLYAIDAQTGQTVWSQQLVGTVIAPVTLVNGVVFVSSTAGAVAFDALSGAYLWDDAAYGLLYSQPVVAGGTLYTTYFNGDVIAWKLTGTDPADSTGAARSLSHGDDHRMQLRAPLRRIQPHR